MQRNKTYEVFLNSFNVQMKQSFYYMKNVNNISGRFGILYDVMFKVGIVYDRRESMIRQIFDMHDETYECLFLKIDKRNRK